MSEIDGPQRRLLWLLSVVLPMAVGPLWVLVCRRLGFTGWAGTFGGFVLLACLAASSWGDVRCFKIPNAVTYPAALWALLVNVVFSVWAKTPPMSSPLTTRLTPSQDWLQSLGAIGISQCLAGFATCFVIMLVGYIISGRGAGDVKLGAVIGAWLGVEYGASALLLSYIVLGALGVCIGIWRMGPVNFLGGLLRRVPRTTWLSWLPIPSREDSAWLSQPTPFAVALTCGTLLVLWRGSVFAPGFL